MKASLFQLGSALLGLAWLSATLSAQDKQGYCNFEFQPVKPITVATVGVISPQTFLLVCNTPDSAIEVYRIDGTSGAGSRRDNPEFKARIPVGLEPVSVHFHRWLDIVEDGETQEIVVHDMMYTANALGDSVTFVELSLDNGAFAYAVQRDVRVTDPRLRQDNTALTSANQDIRCDDEPTSVIAVDRPQTLGQFLLVTKAGASSYCKIDRYTGDPLDMQVSSGCLSDGGANVIMTGEMGGTSGDQVPFGAALSTVDESQDMALKEPRVVALRPDTDEYWVLGHRGGKGTDFDFDLWGTHVNDFTCDGSYTASDYYSVGGLGSTNFNMAFSSDGDYLYVAGTDAQTNITGNGNLLAENTGFVRSILYRVDLTSLPSTTIVPMNLNAFNPFDTATNPTAVASQASLAHPTDVAIYPDSTLGRDFICITAFNSDLFAIIDSSSGTIKRVAVEDPSVSFSTREQSAAGPRGLTVWVDGSASSHRVYTLNSLDSSISIISPNTAGNPTWIAKVPLHHTIGGTNPVVPTYISDGRKFLYSTHFSDSRFVACASCHVDGRLDDMQWRLTAGVTSADPNLPLLPDNIGAAYRDRLEVGSPNASVLIGGGTNQLNLDVTMPNDGTSPSSGANAKKAKITQSLQGLVNFEVSGDLFSQPTDNRFDDLVTNAPYHWRGDKDGFRHFNEAFHNLQGMSNQVNGSTGDTDEPDGGVSGSDMQLFEDFVNSIHYPPNPVQERERIPSGVPWDAETTLPSTNHATDGYLGLMLFHILPGGGSIEFQGLGGAVLLERSCVMCHSLPEGSNNRTTFVDDPPGTTSGSESQPIETAALRGLFQKEGVLELNGSVSSFETTPRLRTNPFGMANRGEDRGLSRNEFLIFARTTNVTLHDLRDAQLSAMVEFQRELDHGVAPIVGFTETVFTNASNSNLDMLEDQARQANCGVAVYARIWSGSAWLEKGYWLRFNATGEPVYKEVGASTELPRTGSGTLLLDPLASTNAGEVFIFRATPIGMERRVAALDGIAETVSTTVPTVTVVGTIPDTFYMPIRDLDPGIPKLSKNWIPTIYGGDFAWAGSSSHIPHSLTLAGMLQTHLGIDTVHDAPRRLQVIGDDLAQGASIRLNLYNGGDARKVLEVPIYPTERFSGEDRVWETAVEFDPTSIYLLVAGGPGRSAVQCLLDAAEPVTSGCASVVLGSTSSERITFQASNDGVNWSTATSQIIPYPPVF